MNDYHPFLNFKEVINSYQDSPTHSTKPYRASISIASNKDNSRRCLQCKRELIDTSTAPYCSISCMKISDSNGPDSWKVREKREKEKNVMLGFSEVF